TTVRASARAGGSPFVTTTSKLPRSRNPFGSSTITISRSSQSNCLARRSPSRGGATEMRTRGQRSRSTTSLRDRARALASSHKMMIPQSSNLTMSPGATAWKLWREPCGEGRGRWGMTAALAEPVERVRQISVLIVEDHVLLADGLAVSLRRESLVVEIADPLSPKAILEAAWRLRPDVVLLDVVLGDAYGISVPLIEPLRATGAQVLILTGVTDPALLGACVEAGAAGLISKREGFDAVL